MADFMKTNEPYTNEDYRRSQPNQTWFQGDPLPGTEPKHFASPKDLPTKDEMDAIVKKIIEERKRNNMAEGFKKAEKKLTSLKIAITGPSGSGKTYSALRIASGLGEKIAVIDTENSSACLYSDAFKFDVLEVEPPYTLDKYLGGIIAAEKANYDVIVIDSISHAWAGEGGLLEKKSALDSRGSGSGYTNWASITKEHEAFKSKILNSKAHLICTMRSKQDYVLEMNDKGKSVPKKVGLAPIQRDGMEYEFTVVLDLGMDHQAISSKDRTGLFDSKVFTPTEETGETLVKWLTTTSKPEPKIIPLGDTIMPIGSIYINKKIKEIPKDALLKAVQHIDQLPECSQELKEFANKAKEYLNTKS